MNEWMSEKIILERSSRISKKVEGEIGIEKDICSMFYPFKGGIRQVELL